MTAHAISAAPELPTLQEQGLNGVVIDACTGIVAPAATPREILVRLASTLGEIMRAPDLRQRIAEFGFEPLADTPAQFAASVQADIERFSTVARQLGIGAARQMSDDRSAKR
jgi:tripartite-type tricarboxylate transporter receptor subunit TctC